MEEKKEEKVETKKKGNGLFTLFACVMTAVIVFLAINLGQKTTKIINPDTKKIDKSNANSSLTFSIEKNIEGDEEYAIVSAKRDRVKVWEYKTGSYGPSELDTFSLYSGDTYLYLAEDGTIKAFDKENGKMIWETNDKFGRSIEMIELNGKICLITFYSEVFSVIDVKTGELDKQINYGATHASELKKSSDTSISFKVNDTVFEYDVNTGMFKNGASNVNTISNTNDNF